MARTADAPPAGTIVLLTRLARAVFVRSSVDLVGMNLRNLVTLAYLRDHPSVTRRTMTEDLSMDSNTGVLVPCQATFARFTNSRSALS